MDYISHGYGYIMVVDILLIMVYINGDYMVIIWLMMVNDG